jgi:hypothetical protein
LACKRAGDGMRRMELMTIGSDDVDALAPTAHSCRWWHAGVVRCQLVILLNVLLTLGACQCRPSAVSLADVTSTAVADSDVDCFLRLAATAFEQADCGGLIWLVQVSREYERGYGWAARLDDGALFVAEFAIDYRTCEAKSIHRATYQFFTATRAAAIEAVFAPDAPASTLTAADYWKSHTEAYAGTGRKYFVTLAPGSELEQVIEWLGGVPTVYEDYPYVPIELSLPWIVSQYYRANEDAEARF